MEQYFYITFKELDRNANGYIAIKSRNEQEVLEYAEQHYKDRFLRIYPEHIFSEAEQNYPDGCLEEISLT